MSSSQRSPTMSSAWAIGQYWSYFLAIPSILAPLLAVVKTLLAKTKLELLACKHRLRKRKERDNGHFRSTQMAGARAPQRGAVHGCPGRRDRECRAALDQGRPRLLAGGPPVGDQRVRPRLRRLPPPRRPGRRPPRAPARLPRRARRLHGRIPSRGTRLERGLPDRRPGTARLGGGNHLTGRPVHPLHDLP